MTNILVDVLQTSISVNGVEYPIDTNFRTCLMTILAFESEELTDDEKQLVLLKNTYADDIPEDTEQAVQQAVAFLDGGLNPYTGGDSKNTRLFSFKRDSSFIYAAFMQTHGIDLQSVKELHWHKFLALFMDLGGETTFCQLTAFRKRLATGKATKEERIQALGMGDMAGFDLMDSRTKAEKDALEEFYRLVEQANERRKEQS